MFAFPTLLRGKRSASRPARLTTAAPRRVRPVVEQLEDRLAPALTGPPVALTISAPSPTVAVGNALPFQATEFDAAGNSVIVTSQVAWSASNGTGQGTIGTASAGTPPGLFTGLSAGTVIVQAVDAQAVAAPLRAQTAVTVVNPGPADTAVTVVSSNAAPVYGEPLLFTATVSTQPPSQATPTGTVDFVFDGTIHASNVHLDSSGKALVSTTLDVANSPHTIVVNYHNSDGRFADSSGSLAGGQTVNKANTTTSYLESKPTTALGHSVTFTTKVSAVKPGDGLPTGTVTFVVDGVSQDPTNLANSQASIPVTFFTLGSHTVEANYNGDGNFNASKATGTVSVTVLAPNQAFVTQLFQDLLNRNATSPELAFWAGKLDSGRESRTQVALDIEQSVEYKQTEVETAHRKFLKRPAAPSELERFVALLRTHTVEQMDALLLGSQEYFEKRGVSSNVGFLNALFFDTLGRSIDPVRQAIFSGELQRGVSRFEVASLVLASLEYKVTLVNDWSLRFLKRHSAFADLPLVGQLLSGTSDEEVIAEIVGSAEYFDNL
jgi:hypothetical protein